MLNHDAAKCPTSGNQDPPQPGDDDDDVDNDADDDHPDVPDVHPNLPHDPMNQQFPDENTEEEHHNASKKRKTNASTSQTDYSFPLVCCDMRQAYATEDTQHCVAKRQRRESEVLEVWNWFMAPHKISGTVRNNNGRTTSTTPHTYREGTVGQKPPEPP